MRIISRKILKKFWQIHHDAEQSLKAWFAETENAEWKHANELKEQFRSASIITNKRVVFNIKGNRYRLVVDIEYQFGIVFIVWIGSHIEYDKIKVKEISYDKTYKK